jgi:hypothetical protein
MYMYSAGVFGVEYGVDRTDSPQRYRLWVWIVFVLMSMGTPHLWTGVLYFRLWTTAARYSIIVIWTDSRV